MKHRRRIIASMLITIVLSLGLLSGCKTAVPFSEDDIVPLGETSESTGESLDAQPEVQVSPLMSPPQTPLPPIDIEAGFAGVEGYMGYRDPLALGRMFIWFCPFTPNSTGVDGIYVLDPSIHPRVEVNADNWFQSGSIEPGQYVLVVGEEPVTARPVNDVERPGHIKVFSLVEGELLEIAVDNSLVTIPED